jgi:hypothetical protein
LFTPGATCSRPVYGVQEHSGVMADFLVVLGIIAFALAMLGLIWGLERV